MKTEISRNNHRPEKRYSGLYQQQGRMITDADWNELVDIVKTQLQKAVSAVVGSGASEETGIIEVVRDSYGYDNNQNRKSRLRWGDIVVDGILASLVPAEDASESFALHGQADLPLPSNFSLSSGRYQLYMDVWERDVISLEDALLVDGALQGADTCSRTQTLAQLKWCPEGIDPEDSGQNPTRGNAEFAIAVRDDVTQLNDPCAAQVGDSNNIGNFLFRVEVHDALYDSDGHLTGLILKWSRENGAEQYALSESLPAGFVSGRANTPEANDWVYEGFNTITEKLLGRHLNSGIRPAVLPIRNNVDFTAVQGEEQPDYVRRWDGYIHLENGNEGWEMIEGVDRRQALSFARVFTGAGDADEQRHGHGHSEIRGNEGNASLFIHLELFNLTLSLADRAKRQFLRGDFWLAVVREVDTDDDPDTAESLVELLNNGQTFGVTHHYLKVGEAELSYAARAIQISNFEVYRDSASDGRRMVYPRLSNIPADRVEYKPERTRGRWADIKELPSDFQETSLPHNVQDAIDDLVKNLESSDVRFSMPACIETDYGVATFNTLLSRAISDLLDTEFDPQNLSLSILLQGILCSTDATVLPYDASSQVADWKQMTSSTPPEPSTVQSAIDLLVRHLNQLRIDVLDQLAGQGCAITVGKNGNFETLQDAFSTFSESDSINICLLAGDFEISAPLLVKFANTIKISGAGIQSSRIVVRRRLIFESLEVILCDLQVDALDSPGNVNIVANRVDVSHCFFKRYLPENATWVRTFGSDRTDLIWESIQDDEGNIYCVGSYHSHPGADPGIDFGNGTVLPPSQENSADIFVVKFDSRGIALWAKKFGGGDRDIGVSVKIDSENHVLIAGNYRGSVDFGTDIFDSGGRPQAFLVKLDGDDASVLWAIGLHGEGSISTSYSASIDIGLENEVIWVGTFQGIVNREGETVLPVNSDLPDGVNHCFVMNIKADGNSQWVRNYYGSTVQRLNACASNDGTVVVTGTFESGELNLGNDIILSAAQSRQRAIFLMAIDPIGETRWGKRFSVTDSYLWPTALSLWSSDRIFLSVYTESPITDFGDGWVLKRRSEAETFYSLLDIETGDILSLSSSTGSSGLGQFASQVVEGSDGHAYLARLFSDYLYTGENTIPDLVSLERFSVVYAINPLTRESEILAQFQRLAGSIRSISVDERGYLVLVGTFRGRDNDFGNGTFFDARGTDAFVVKISHNHSPMLSIRSIKSWVARISEGEEIKVLGVATDSTNAKLVTGYFVGAVNIGGRHYTSQGDEDNEGGGGSSQNNGGREASQNDDVSVRDAFIAKVGLFGEFLWFKQLQAPGGASGNSVAIDENDNILIAGNTIGALDSGDGFSGDEAQGGSDIFVIKLDTFGNTIWLRSFGGESNDEGNAIAVDGANNIVVAGPFSGTMTIDDGIELRSEKTEIFVLKLDKDGRGLWAANFGSQEVSLAQALAVDEENAIYVTGGCVGTIALEGIDSSESEGGDTNAFVVKFNADGRAQWLRRYDSPSTGDAIKIQGDNVYLAGRYSNRFFVSEDIPTILASGSSDRFILQLNLDGQPHWVLPVSSESFALGIILEVDRSGHLLVAGNFSNTIQLGDSELSLVSSEDNYPPHGVFLATIDATGRVINIDPVRGQESIVVSGIAVDGNNTITLAGRIEGDVRLIADGSSQTYAGSNGIYIANIVNASLPPSICIDKSIFEMPAPSSNVSGNIALELRDTDVNVNISDNRIDGRVFHGAFDFQISDFNVPIISGRSASCFTASDNHIRQFVSNLPYEAINKENVYYYSDMTFFNNTFAMANNRFITPNLVFVNNNFHHVSGEDIAQVRTNSFVVSGNIGKSNQTLTYYSHDGRYEHFGNLIRVRDKNAE